MTWLTGWVRCTQCLRYGDDFKGRPGQHVRFTYVCKCGNGVIVDHTFPCPN